MNKTLTITLNGKEITFEEKSHAAIFRSFFAHFMNEDLDKTIETIEKTGVRTSENPNFVAVNGQKKKNIFVKDGFYIYTHLTPPAMKKTYEKFVFVWEGGVLEAKAEATKPEDKPEEQPETPQETPQETPPVTPSDEVPVETVKGSSADDELTPQQKAAITRKRNAEAKKARLEAIKTERRQKEAEEKAQQLSAEEINNIEL